MATLKDISAKTGVSIRTVSRALKNDGYIKEDVRQKVLAAASELNYSPNRMALSLKTSKSYEICVLTWSTDELHMKKIASLEKKMRQHGYQISLMIDSPDSSDESKNDMIEDIIRRRPAGVVTLPAYVDHDRMALERFVEVGVLCIAIDPRHEHKERVEVDRQEGVYQAVKYLAGKYGSDTAYFGIPSEGHNETRLEGYQRAMTEFSFKAQIYEFNEDLESSYDREIAFVREKYPSTEMKFSDMAHQYAAGLNAAEHVKENCPRAALLFSDMMCMGFLKGLNGSGISIPEDLAIIGFDDRSFSALSTPALTTISHPNEEVGVATAEILLSTINDEDKGLAAKKLTPTLVKRLST
jgi:DNA-binding LacI/PurR family transcriptional regulator